MPAQSKRFMILALSDRDEFGFNEETLPLLVTLMESASPDYLNALFLGVTGYFIASNRSADRVEKAILDAEKLRDSDSRFSRLGIGLAEGDMLASFHWWGGLKSSNMPPLGQAANEATRSALSSDSYHEKLKAFRNQKAAQSL